ncbi:Bcr/CflA family efflux MFS transporter [Thalassotalea psychrophila]|uniref:Bcr/CflA family efflux transporter n=1 Tax=Thalassotalea psychrophila TaxID=3065647 RepID=A0ABY9TSV4_9GAMM|nr:Bcr/CflA family efflux MFS transporter [Colwelliaceae bacterium SQ149]
MAKQGKNNNISISLLLPLLASIVAITPLAVDLYLPAMPIIAQYFNSSIAAVQNSLSVYLAGYACGLILFGPLADIIGRRKLAIFGLSFFSIISFAIPLSQTIDQFIWLRFAQAFCGSAATVVVPGIIRQFYGANTAKGMSYVSMIMMFAPMLAPTIGSAILVIANWQAMFYFLGVYSLIILIASVTKLPEMVRNDGPGIEKVSFFGNYKVVLSNKAARKYILSSMLVSLAFFAYLTAIPFVYLEVYKTSEFVFSFLFGINVVALMMAQLINTRCVGKYGSEKMLLSGLLVALISAVTLVVVNILELSLFWTVITIMPLMGSISLIAVNADSLILLTFANQTGTATAVIGTLRFGIGALAGPILAFFHTDSALPFTVLMLTSIILVGLCQYSPLKRKL